MEYNAPLNLEAALSTSFGGKKYQPGRCAYKVWHFKAFWFPTQCTRKNGHGPAGLYCKQHARLIKP